ncbi:MAG TPA: Terminase-like family protein, partial [Desulfobacteraceae bacterium]|nr:Terminase-like family protein [Desulfobacteraceae bacterium]
IGQAFPFNYARHVIKPIPIPQYAPIYMTFDWGYAKPFSFGWWWLDADNRLYRFAEWYGWNKTPDEG